MRRAQPEECVPQQVEAAAIRLDEAASEREQCLAADSPIVGERAGPRGREFDRHLGREVDPRPLLPQKGEARRDSQVANAAQERRRTARGWRQGGKIALLRVRDGKLRCEREWPPQMRLQPEPTAGAVPHQRRLSPRLALENERTPRIVGPGAELEALLAGKRRPCAFDRGIAVTAGRGPEERYVGAGRLRVKGGRKRERDNRGERPRAPARERGKEEGDDEQRPGTAAARAPTARHARLDGQERALRRHADLLGSVGRSRRHMVAADVQRRLRDDAPLSAGSELRRIGDAVEGDLHRGARGGVSRDRRPHLLDLRAVGGRIDAGCWRRILRRRGSDARVDGERHRDGGAHVAQSVLLDRRDDMRAVRECWCGASPFSTCVHGGLANGAGHGSGNERACPGGGTCRGDRNDGGRLARTGEDRTVHGRRALDLIDRRRRDRRLHHQYVGIRLWRRRAVAGRGGREHVGSIGELRRDAARPMVVGDVLDRADHRAALVANGDRHDVVVVLVLVGDLGRGAGQQRRCVLRW